MKVWRLNIKPASKNIDPRKFCLQQNIMGVGWPIDTKAKKIEWDEYYKKAKKFYKEERNDNGWWRALNAIKNRIKADDLCWTRDLNGNYYIGRVLDNEWRYSNDQVNKQADIVNYRNCRWYKVGEVDSVPGKVVNRFIRGGTIERVKGETIREFSKYLYNSISCEPHYQIKQVETDFYSLIHSDDCEDIVGMYLQNKGYHIIPSSCKKSTVNYEFILKHNLDGHKGVAQVKKGEVDLYFDNYTELNSKVYLFTTRGKYIGKPTAEITVIQEHEIQSFIDDNFDIMPDKVQTWMRIYNQLNNI
ncbi:MAG: hypothetical protein HUJ22_12925 [Gracilimonas sp.]|uniref:hypothetical protein n=1 Tax=Gracilimonas sp. TaxID=1974203 RepID=UPI0019C15335|nr:hypothetical protein [Gracilimonas sp.]MBD3617465.1 hypothetical protein [Gracilimonas sp.]